MSEHIITSDLSKFGSRERAMLVKLLTAQSEQGLPEDFDTNEVVPMMNMNSGNVFLTNSDYDVAMMNGDKLESFYSCPECGHEGFKEDMLHDGNVHCRSFMRDIDATESVEVLSDDY
jgi:hypothetical protein